MRCEGDTDNLQRRFKTSSILAFLVIDFMIGSSLNNVKKDMDYGKSEVLNFNHVHKVPKEFGGK